MNEQTDNTKTTDVGQPSGASCYTPFSPPFKYDKMANHIIDNDGNMVFDMRGWGYLTGTGGLHYSPEKASGIQDRIGERVAKLMSEDAEGITRR